MYTQLGLAYKSWVSNIDLLFVPAHVLPYLKSPFVPSVVVVHDIRTEFLPQHSNPIQRIYLNKWVERTRAMLATKIIAVSESTKRDLIAELGVSEDKIKVVYEGVNADRFAVSNKDNVQEIERVKCKYDTTGSYLLFVGTVQPRKNVSRLIEAYSRVKNELGNIKLVVAGKRGWMAGKIYRAPRLHGVEKDVVFIDYVEDDNLPFLYAGAKAFVFPSLYEGFGLPVLESYASGIPVLTSDISSLPEVGGDYAVYVNPTDVDSIAKGMRDVIFGEFDSNVLRAYAQSFSWQKAGVETVKLFEEVLGRRLR